ncbi:PRC-barrel domain-containing protein [Ahrensia sp. 13_GOM-1096m]|uniref:PRC-barrel domain-containing protein n=1 Tax=Ahrensia sp. 13_GOM-1096m TaxID=1380380 RepID=UPI000686B998|nr:PRC-barrel domain-containing protein [Ahrensia sp. 13_GOM-1096m]
MISDTPLIASDDIEGTKVFNLQGDTIAHIDHLMIDRKTGLTSYAIIHFGGFLGVGEETRPIPWRKLSYDDKKIWLCY